MAIRIGILEIEESLTLHEIKKRQPCKASVSIYCHWWRRGRVELPVHRKVARISYKLSQLHLSRLTFIC